MTAPTITAPAITAPAITSKMSILEKALALAASGFEVFPVDHPGLTRCAGAGIGHADICQGPRGKHPAVSFALAATTNPKMIKTWFEQQRNIGIKCGSDLIVIDEDTVGELARFAEEHRVIIPDTMVVTTAKGRHYYFLARPGHHRGNQEGEFGPYDINVRSGNAYAVAPGSMHATGVDYTLTTALAPAPVPDWIIDAIDKGRPPLPVTLPSPTSSPDGQSDRQASEPSWEAVDPFGDEPRGLAAVPPLIRGPRANRGGERHQVLVAYASSLRGRSLPYDEATVLYEKVWKRCEQPPACTTSLSWTDAQAKLGDVYSRYPEGSSAEYRTEATADETADPQEPPRRRIILTPAAEIVPRRVRWLWDGRLALGTLGLLAGREGVGKSTIGYWGAARITRGELPGEFSGQPRTVLVCATEDSWSHTIVPRLIAAGADLARVLRVEVETDTVHVGLAMPRDLEQVEAAARETDAVLLLLDPLMSRLDASLDSHRDHEVRLALEPLTTMADRVGLCVLGLIHHNKSGSTDLLQLVMASRAFTAVARSVHTVVPDDDDGTGNRKLFGTPKNNLGRTDLPTLTFTIESFALETDDGTAWTGRLVWGEDSTVSIAEAMRQSARPGEDREERSAAAEWLLDYLTERGGSDASKEVKRAAFAAGISDQVIRRARERLRLLVESKGFPRVTTWTLPESISSSGVTSRVTIARCDVQGRWSVE